MLAQRRRRQRSDGVCGSWPVFWTDPIGEERNIERIRALEAAGIGEISFPSVCITVAGAERIKELGREIVSRYQTAFRAAQRVVAELMGLSALFGATNQQHISVQVRLWID